jgi:hypothetical protein
MFTALTDEAGSLQGTVTEAVATEARRYVANAARRWRFNILYVSQVKY